LPVTFRLLRQIKPKTVNPAIMLKMTISGAEMLPPKSFKKVVTSVTPVLEENINSILSFPARGLWAYSGISTFKNDESNQKLNT